MPRFVSIAGLQNVLPMCSVPCWTHSRNNQFSMGFRLLLLLQSPSSSMLLEGRFESLGQKIEQFRSFLNYHPATKSCVIPGIGVITSRNILTGWIASQLYPRALMLLCKTSTTLLRIHLPHVTPLDAPPLKCTSQTYTHPVHIHVGHAGSSSASRKP